MLTVFSLIFVASKEDLLYMETGLFQDIMESIFNILDAYNNADSRCSQSICWPTSINVSLL